MPVDAYIATSHRTFLQNLLSLFFGVYRRGFKEE